MSTIDSAPITDRLSSPSHGRRSPASFSWRAIGCVFALTALSVGLNAGMGSTAADAAAEPPGAAWSHYVKTTKSRALYRLGCAQGRRTRRDASVRDTIAILDFGRPVSRRFHNHHGPRHYGASLFRKHGFASVTSILRASEAYGRGVWNCTRGLEQFRIRVGIGTSNWGHGVTRAHGKSWAELVNQANVWGQARGYGTKIEFAGANDIELSWNTPRATKAWVHGYESVAKHPYYDYGAAEACPPIRRCAGAWTLEDVWYVSWGALHAWPIPEIYTPNWSNARQWYNLALYSYKHHGAPMRIVGVISQRGACRVAKDPCRGMNNSPVKAWRQLTRLLNRDPRTRQHLLWATDIR